jgi:hypothetical protein
MVAHTAAPWEDHHQALKFLDVTLYDLSGIQLF